MLGMSIAPLDRFFLTTGIVALALWIIERVLHTSSNRSAWADYVRIPIANKMTRRGNEWSRVQKMPMYVQYMSDGRTYRILPSRSTNLTPLRTSTRNKHAREPLNEYTYTYTLRADLFIYRSYTVNWSENRSNGDRWPGFRSMRCSNIEDNLARNERRKRCLFVPFFCARG